MVDRPIQQGAGLRPPCYWSGMREEAPTALNILSYQPPILVFCVSGARAAAQEHAHSGRSRARPGRAAGDTTGSPCPCIAIPANAQPAAGKAAAEQPGPPLHHQTDLHEVVEGVGAADRAHDAKHRQVREVGLGAAHEGPPAQRAHPLICRLPGGGRVHARQGSVGHGQGAGGRWREGGASTAQRLPATCVRRPPVPATRPPAPLTV